MTTISDTSAPVIRTPARESPVVAAAPFAGAALLALFIGHAAEHGHLPFPGCGLKTLTGLACPGCGGTRALAALAALDPAQAFALNPAITAAVLLAFIGLPLAVLDGHFNQARLTRRVGAWSRTRGLTRLLAVVLAVNWIYLLVVGR